MRCLIAPMAALAETKGPISRARALAIELKKRGHEVAFCAAKDFNYQAVEGVKNYGAPLPSPFGTPLFIGKRVFKLIQKLGIQQRKRVRSFEEVLHIVGATAKKFFPKDVQAVRQAIQDFKPDVVFAEFRIAAIVAAKWKQANVVTGYSYPVQPSYRSNPEYSDGVKEFLHKHDLPVIESVLEIFDWAQLKFVASSYELEPIDGPNVFHVGPFVPLPRPKETANDQNKIVAYMGSGTISPRTLVQILDDEFQATQYQVYIASKEMTPMQKGNIQVAHYFDFTTLMPEAVAFINHGGQNSIMTGLVNGVPQIVSPGKIFERQYNAESVSKLGAGKVLATSDFTGRQIRRLVETFEADTSYRDNARQAGENLLALGGVSKAVDILENHFA